MKGKDQDNNEDIPHATVSEMEAYREDSVNELPIPGGAHPIQITQDTVFFADRDTGTILGPKAEGTLGIILYGERADVKGAEGARAIRVPRLLCSDILLNFHIAEIANCEGHQASKFIDDPGLLGAISFGRLNIPGHYNRIPGHEGSTFLGFYLSPAFQYKACLLSKDRAWPKEFEDYLKSIRKAPRELFEMIETNAKPASWYEDYNPQNLDNLIFVPRYPGGSKNENPGESSNTADVICLSREKLHLTSRKRNVSGWWFNLPVSVSRWMTADLQRLLTAAVGGGEDLDEVFHEVEQLKKWDLTDWFQMFFQLALGFYYLHTRKVIHGDPRPANIMSNVPAGGQILPGSFNWIDIGLGYEVKVDINPDDSRKTSVTPRPLGGSRTTPFYAPERIEGRELEDADHIKVVKDKNDFLLSFYFRHKTDRKLTPLRLKEKEKPVRELGSLHEGDRIQVREFLFTVKQVTEFHIVVSKIYEIVLDRVLIDKSTDQESQESDPVPDTLKNASISRYRIFKQWSQATDIYGLGLTILYTVFMRGFSRIDSSRPGVDKNMEKDHSPGKVEADDNVLVNGSPIESIFLGLSQVLRSQAFLLVFLKEFTASGFVKEDLIWQKEILDAKYVELQPDTPGSSREDPGQEKEQDHDPDIAVRISNIVRKIMVFDYNFDYVLKGLDGRIGLLAQLLYFCLCCVWRQDEWTEIEAAKGVKIFNFLPFCKNRRKIPGDQNPGLPAEKARDKLQILIRNISSMSDDYTDVQVMSRDIIPGSKDEQISRLMRTIEKLQENLEREKGKRTGEFSLMSVQLEEKERENISLKRRIADVRREKEKSIASYRNQIERLVNEGEMCIGKYLEKRRASLLLNLPLVKRSVRKAEIHLEEILSLIRGERG